MVNPGTTLDLKRPAFFACATSFTEETSVILLTINLFKKELQRTTDTPSVLLALSTLA